MAFPSPFPPLLAALFSFSNSFLFAIIFSVFLAITIAWILLKPSPPPLSPHRPRHLLKGVTKPDEGISGFVTPFTPLRKSQALPPDTKVKPRSLVDLSTLASGRQTITNDIHEIPQVDLDYFLNFVLPRADIGNFNEGAKAFKGAVRTSFRKDPKDANETETQVFSAMEAVFKRVAKAVGSSKRSQTYYHSSPSRAPSADAPSTSIPDMCLIRDGGTHRWEDIALTFEVKKTASEKNIGDNQAKIIWNMHQTLRTDPCRCFAFGITIENTEMQLWLMARGVVLASGHFNFVQDDFALLKVLSSFLYAPRTSLGWDPTIERIEKGRYSITHDGKKYVDCEIIYALGAELARGRCTRVFRGEGQDGNEYVIRDLWNDSDRKTEVEIMEDIEWRTRRKKELKELFLQAIADVRVRIDDNLDTVLECVLHGECLPPHYQLLQVSKLTEAGASRPQGSLHAVNDGKLRCRADVSRRLPYVLQYKKHERHVVRERGKAVDELDSFQDLFTALLGALSCLEVVFDANYVHRDVTIISDWTIFLYLPLLSHLILSLVSYVSLSFSSPDYLISPIILVSSLVALSSLSRFSLGLGLETSQHTSKQHFAKSSQVRSSDRTLFVTRDVSAGNILLVNGHGVLADFEYAKATDDVQKHDIRTGTEEYMALEVLEQGYRHFPIRLTLGPFGTPPFRHNALHDLESLLWVAIWFAFSAEFVDELGDYKRADENREAQMKSKKELFEDRKNFLRNSRSLLIPDSGPAPLDSKANDIVIDLVALLGDLDEWYSTMEKTHESIAKFKISADQIKAFRNCFNKLLNMSHGLPVLKLGPGEVVKRQAVVDK